MTFLKRAIATLSVFSVLVVGSLSFMPNSFAVDDYQFPFSSLDIPEAPYSNNFVIVFNYSSTLYYLQLYSYDCPIKVSYSGSTLTISRNDSTPNQIPNNTRYTYRSDRDSWSTGSASFSTYTVSYANSLGSPVPYSSSGSVTFDGSFPTSFSYSFTEPAEPISSIPRYWDYMPFFFPELPYGVFDGNFLSQNGNWYTELDFDNLTGTSTGSYSYSESGSGSGTYSGSSSSSGGTISGGTYTGSGSLTVPSGQYGWYSGDNYGRVNDNDTSQGELYFDGGQLGTVSTSGTFTGSVSGGTGTESGNLTISSLNESGSGSLSVGQTYSGDVLGSFVWRPNYADHARFRTWAVVSGTAYVYFISDVRNRITATLESVSDSGGMVRYLCKGDDNVFYPCYCVTFNYMGEKLESFSQLANGITVDFAPGVLSQDEESGKWSCDPLYHGVWFSNQSPSLNLSSLTETESLKWLANPVFGESAFVLNFLDSINSTLTTLNENLVSLTSAMQSSISNQTSSILGATAAPATQPNTSQLSNYFMQESAFNAPDTDSVFSGGISNAPMWSGVTWWSTKFNDLIIRNNTIVAFTTAMLTLGLAVFIIGRRVNTK